MSRKGRPITRWDKLTLNLRRKARLTQSQLANVLGATQPAVSIWEKGFSTPTKAYRRKLEVLA